MVKVKTELKEIHSRTLREAIIDIARTSTGHGIAKIFGAKTLVHRIMWITSYLVAWCFIIYLVYSILFNYQKHEVVTNVDVYTEIPLKFPGVTFCNLNSLIHLDPLKFKEEYEKKLQHILGANKTFSELKIALWVQIIEFHSKNLLEWSQVEERQLEKIYDQTVISCLFGSRPCNRDDFEIYFNLNFGVCFKFNTMRSLENNRLLRRSNRAGKLDGLQIEMWSGESGSVIPGLPTAFEKGIHLEIHENTKEEIIQSEGISIQPGVVTNVAIRLVNTIKKQEPYGACKTLKTIDDHNSYLYKETFKFYKQYRQFDCYDLCLQKMMIQECHCYSSLLHKLDGTNQCTNTRDVYCSVLFFQMFIHQGLHRNCTECPIECETNSYPMSLSFSDFQDEYISFMFNNSVLKSKFQRGYLDISEIKKHVASFNIYYDELKYTNITQLAKLTEVDLLAGIGGFSGLFLGASFLTFTELFELILTILMAKFKPLNCR